MNEPRKPFPVLIDGQRKFIDPSRVLLHAQTPLCHWEEPDCEGWEREELYRYPTGEWLLVTWRGITDPAALDLATTAAFLTDLEAVEKLLEMGAPVPYDLQKMKEKLLLHPPSTAEADIGEVPLRYWFRRLEGQELGDSSDPYRFLRRYLHERGSEDFGIDENSTQADIASLLHHDWEIRASMREDAAREPEVEQEAELIRDVYAEVLRFAGNNLKGNERRALELLCQRGGEYPLEELAKAIGWDAPYDDAFNSTKKRLNEKLEKAKLPWRVIRHDNTAKLVENRTKKT